MVVAVQTLSVRVAGHDYRIRCLRDRLQLPDPMFGVLWDSGNALAEEMAAFAIEGKRILEVGCGLALPSLVLKRRGADITASDRHPMAAEFLRANCELNGLPAIPFVFASWDKAELGKYDLLIGADLVYEPDLPALLAAFLARHAAPEARVIIADPGRRELARFKNLMMKQNFTHTEKRFAPRGRILTFRQASAR